MPAYYFDASDAAPTDPDSAWTNDANVFDIDESTAAEASAGAGSVSTRFLLAEGTNAPDNGLTIFRVKARVYGSGLTSPTVDAAIYTDGLGELLGTAQHNNDPGWGSYITLSTPTGGWTWVKVQALEVKLYNTSAIQPKSANKVEVLVELESIPGRIYRVQGFQ